MRVCSVKNYVENLRALAVCGEGEPVEAESGEEKRDQAERNQAGPIDVWNEQAWCLLVTQVTVYADGSAEFLFRGENRITVK